MFIIYDIVTLLVIIFYLPVYLLKGKFHKGFLARLGILPKDLSLGGPVWIHAVSLGEAVLVRGTYECIKKSFPSKRIVFSTVTLTGNKIAAGYCNSDDFVTFLPLDFSFLVNKFVERINPSVFVIAETEIWPNLISCLYRRKVPIIVINTRISDASFRGYMSVKVLIKPILNKVTFFCAQSEEDARRLIALGVENKRIEVTGNVKFDAARPLPLDFNAADYRNKLGLSKEDKVFIAASTHPAEEAQILAVYKELLKDFPNLKLILAPRHPERASAISGLAGKYGFNPVSINSLEGRQHKISRGDIFILDFIGRLVYYYAIADVVFVGGSLVKTGGHNILEPAALGKPVIFGPNMSNFRDIADLFIKNQAGIQVRDSVELKGKIKILFKKPELAASLCRAEKKLILLNKGATLKNLEHIKEYVNY